MEWYYVCVKVQKNPGHNLPSKLFSHIQEICLDIATVKLYKESIWKKNYARNIKDLSVWKLATLS